MKFPARGGRGGCRLARMMRVVAVARLARCARSSRCSWHFTTIVNYRRTPNIIYLHGCRTGGLLIDLDAAGGNACY